MSDHLNNPAGRLYSFLRFMRAGHQQTETIANRWAAYIGLEPVDGVPLYADHRLFDHCGIMLTQPALLEAAVVARPVDSPPASFLLGSMTAVRNALGRVASIGSSLQDMFNAYTEADLVTLQAASYNLATYSQEPTIPLEEVDRLLEMARAIIRDSGASQSLPDELAAFVVEHATQIQDALLRYKSGGSGSLRRSIDATIGELVRSPGLYEKLKTSPAGKAFWTLFNGALLATTLMSNVATITASNGEQHSPPPIEIIVQNFSDHAHDGPSLDSTSLHGEIEDLAKK